MRLINGLVFGTGLGLVTAGAGGFANGYTSSVYAAGALLISAALARLFIKHARNQREDQQ